MPMLHMAGLGCGCGMGDTAVLTMAEVQGWTDEKAYGVMGTGVSALTSDPAIVGILRQKAINWVNTWSDKDTYQRLHGNLPGDLPGAPSIPPMEVYSTGLDPAVMEVIKWKAANYLAATQKATLVATQTWWQWLQGQHIIPGVPDWATVGVAAAGVLYLMFKSKSEG